MKLGGAIQCALMILGVSSVTSVAALGQAVQREHQVQEVWSGVVINSEIGRSYALSLFGSAEFQSPRLYRDSKYVVGLRISRAVPKAFRVGIECLQERGYLGNSSLFIENRCAVDVVRKWDRLPNTRFYLQPKLELRSLAGTFDQRLKIRGELLHDVPALRGTFRGFVEPAFDHRFRGFEKIYLHGGVLWPMGKRFKVELFDVIVAARSPDRSGDAIGMTIFLRLWNPDTAGGEINR